MKTIMNITYIKASILLVAISCLYSCSKDESCGYNETDNPVACVPNQTDKANAGFTVTTAYQFQSNPAGWVGGIYDTRLNSQAPVGDDWGTGTPTVSVQRPANWRANEIGQVFGIAIDAEENIFLASSDVYFGSSFSNSTQQAQLFKCISPSYNAVPFLQFTTGTDPFNDLGNIVYDKLNDQLFVSNLEDGKIYRITNLSGTTGIIADSYDPWAADASGAGVIAPQDEQVWGVGVNYEGGDVKVYFPRISNTERSIYSITLNTDGSLPLSTTTADLEISNISGDQNMITDIAFSSDFQKMLIAERGEAHYSKTLSYVKSGGSWASEKKYFIGYKVSSVPITRSGENSAGGVDFYTNEIDGNISASCGENFWATGNFMRAINTTLNQNMLIYGIEGISFSGNQDGLTPLTGNQYTDIFIDYDGQGDADSKGGIGDVEVFDADTCFNLCDF